MNWPARPWLRIQSWVWANTTTPRGPVLRPGGHNPRGGRDSIAMPLSRCCGEWVADCGLASAYMTRPEEIARVAAGAVFVGAGIQLAEFSPLPYGIAMPAMVPVGIAAGSVISRRFRPNAPTLPKQSD